MAAIAVAWNGRVHAEPGFCGGGAARNEADVAGPLSPEKPPSALLPAIVLMIPVLPSTFRTRLLPKSQM